jgi:deuterolysin
MVVYDTYFDIRCHAQDQATTTLHEFTHAPGVYSPGTEDNGYGYDAATALSADAALNNADSYALYANGEAL